MRIRLISIALCLLFAACDRLEVASPSERDSQSEESIARQSEETPARSNEEFLAKMRVRAAAECAPTPLNASNGPSSRPQQVQDWQDLTNFVQQQLVGNPQLTVVEPGNRDPTRGPIVTEFTYDDGGPQQITVRTHDGIARLLDVTGCLEVYDDFSVLDVDLDADGERASVVFSQSPTARRTLLGRLVQEAGLIRLRNPLFSPTERTETRQITMTFRHMDATGWEISS